MFPFLKKSAPVSGDAVPSVKILGPICGFCQNIDKPVQEAMTQLGLDLPVIHVTEVADIAAYGVKRVPALVLNEQVLSSGVYLTTEQALELLQKALQ